MDPLDDTHQSVSRGVGVGVVVTAEEIREDEGENGHGEESVEDLEKQPLRRFFARRNDRSDRNGLAVRCARRL